MNNLFQFLYYCDEISNFDEPIHSDDEIQHGMLNCDDISIASKELYLIRNDYCLVYYLTFFPLFVYSLS